MVPRARADADDMMMATPAKPIGLKVQIAEVVLVLFSW